MEPWDIRDREEVVREFCKIGTMAQEVFEYKEASDCFCMDSDPSMRRFFRYSTRVIEFVREAVEEKIAREAGGDDAGEGCGNE